MKLLAHIVFHGDMSEKGSVREGDDWLEKKINIETCGHTTIPRD